MHRDIFVDTVAYWLRTPSDEQEARKQADPGTKSFQAGEPSPVNDDIRRVTECPVSVAHCSHPRIPLDAPDTLADEGRIHLPYGSQGDKEIGTYLLVHMYGKPKYRFTDARILRKSGKQYRECSRCRAAIARRESLHLIGTV